MDNLNKKDTELESILKEISSFDDPVVSAPAAAPAQEEQPAEKKAAPKAAKPDRGIPMEKRLMATMKANKEKKAEEKRALETQQAIEAQQLALDANGLTPVQETEPAQKPAAAKKTVLKKPAVKQTAAKTEEPAAAPAEPKTEAQPAAEPKSKGAKLPKLEKKEKAPKQEKAPKAPKAPKEPKPVRELPKIAVALLVVVSMLCMFWVSVSVHPDTETATSAATAKKLNLADTLNVYMNNAASDALGNLTYIKKLFTIDESALVAPKPQAEFHSTFDTAEVEAVIAQAEELLDGQTLAWNPNLNFWEEEPIQYYYDETILAITWKEIINGNMVSFAEVKMAHGSQLRRALAGNAYGSSVEEYPTNMASNVNAVLAISGDFYNFRDLGITVYQRQLYRHAPKSVDTAYFTADGDMIFSKRGELTDKAEAEQFIADNDVIFSVAFGPILVEDGQLVTTTQYPIGEIEKKYSRTAIGQKDELHYVLMTVNYEGPCQVTCTLAQAAQYIYDKGVEKAYALDGGQTSSMVFNGELVNRVDWGNERTMSDIIYFATAVPEGGTAE